MAVMTRLALFGPPGADTADVADHLAVRLGLLRISMREAAQSATRAGSELGDQLRRFMDAEHSPPDELVAALILRRLGEPDAAGGFVFWASDAKALPLVVRSLAPLEIQVIELVLADAEATRRLTGRRLCRDCGKLWHIESTQTLDADVCDWCGGELFQRQDDAPATVARRLSAYRERSSPVLEYYRAADRLISVDATCPAEHIAADLTRRIEQR
ncbi:nucleoside monophosphate kinase [Dactylosporangium sp. NPDC000244]|uniref:adenylate kinase family protein n=1 Tax=Dactylosporangium sp. NPDC000244 TaxID=3154365 RepID=UPI00332367A5